MGDRSLKRTHPNRTLSCGETAPVLPTKKGQVYFGRFYLGKRRQGRDAYSVAALFLGEGSINGTESPF